MSLEGKIRVLVVDDHPVVREGLTLFLAGQDDFELAGQASSGEEAVEMVNQIKPNVILMDLKMPGIGGIEAIRQIKKDNPTVKILALTVYTEDEYVKEALRAGAQGYLLKEVSQAELLEAIRAVMRDESYLAPKVAVALVSELDESKKRARLTKREKEVLQCMAEGLTNKEIADRLNLGVETIKTHARNIYEKLGAADRAQAVAIALRKGYFE
jgi:two-component system NarL family response regulator